MHAAAIPGNDKPGVTWCRSQLTIRPDRTNCTELERTRAMRVVDLPGAKPLRGSYSIEPIEAVAETIARLLHPHAEIVLHDLVTGKIAKIWNPFSGRKPGEASDLDDIDPELQDSNVVGPYEKASSKGTRLKSISTILRDEIGHARAMLCINLDVSQFDAAATLLQSLASASEARPEWMFRRDIREQINLQIADYLKRHNVALGSLEQDGRRDLVAFLDGCGAFQARRAVDHIAAALDLSRTTVYVLLREAREMTHRERPGPKQRRRR
jgi:predicted transcriptional regulator YheO